MGEPNQMWNTTGLHNPIRDGDVLIVTAQDGSTTVTYTIDVIPPSTDAALSDLRYDGTLVPGFNPDTTAYHIEFPYGTTHVPTVTATVRDTGKATRVITQATGLTAPNNVATVVVTAEDGETQRTYTVTFTVAKNDKAEITAFNLPHATGPATIDTVARTIEFELGGSDDIDITNLVATFSLSAGATAKVNGVPQTSGVTSNDFTNPVTYVVTAENGIVVKEWTVSVTNVRVNSITIEGMEGRLDVGLNCTVPLVAVVKPECASNKAVTWSVVNGTGKATIDQNGVLTGTQLGTVTVRATATDGTGVVGSAQVTIRDYPILGVAWSPQSGSYEMQRLGDGRGKTGGTIFNNIYPWSGMNLCMLWPYDPEVRAYKGQYGFKLNDPDFPVMVEIPKFYYKREFDPATGTSKFWIAAQPTEGFSVHPAFVHTCARDHVHELDKLYVGAYEAGTIVDDYGDTILTSCSGVAPVVSEDMYTVRDHAEYRTYGCHALTDVDARDAITLLYMVEYANLDSQAVLGKGITELRYSPDDVVTVRTTSSKYITVSAATGAHYQVGDYVGLGIALGKGDIFERRKITAKTTVSGGNVRLTVDGFNNFTADVGNVLYHVAQPTGGCDSLNGVSGSAGGDKTSGRAAVSYRGFENLWGNVDEFVDGINIYYCEQEPADNRKPFVSNTVYMYFNNKFEPVSVDEEGTVYKYGYNPVNITLPENAGWITNFVYAEGDGWMLMPASTDSTDSSYIPDYYLESWDEEQTHDHKVLAAGGDWFSSSGAGMFHRNVSPYACNGIQADCKNDQYINIGSRLMVVPFGEDCLPRAVF